MGQSYGLSAQAYSNPQPGLVVSEACVDKSLKLRLWHFFFSSLTFVPFFSSVFVVLAYEQNDRRTLLKIMMHFVGGANFELFWLVQRTNWFSQKIYLILLKNSTCSSDVTSQEASPLKFKSFKGYQIEIQTWRKIKRIKWSELGNSS